MEATKLFALATSGSSQNKRVNSNAPNKLNENNKHMNPFDINHRIDRTNSAGKYLFIQHFIPQCTTDGTIILKLLIFVR